MVNAVYAVLDALRPSAAGKRYNQLITYVDDRLGHDKRYAIDASKIKSQLGWQPRENFDTGIEKTVRWYISNAGWWQPIRRGRYSGERLGRS